MGISKNEGLKRLNNSVTYDRGVLQIWILVQIKHPLYAIPLNAIPLK